ncbi:MAG: sigma-54-dependent transcriptional regulator [Gammaproteobacteria bacterium]
MSARILVVDDEPDIRFLLRDILEDEGYEVDIAEHARAANEKRQSNMPDLVLLDIWMPEIDGVTLLKEWKASKSDDCPVVMMSGHGTVETAVEATKFGAYDFVEKPLSMAKLLSTVKAALSSTSKWGRQGSYAKKEEPVGNSRAVRQLKLQFQSLGDSTSPVFLTGATAGDRGVWASYLSELSHPGKPVKVFDPNQGAHDFLSLDCNLYVEEILDLDKNRQAEIYRRMQEDNEQFEYRLILSSRLDRSRLVKHPEMLPELAQYWRNAVRIPSLNEHIEDIPELLEYYVNWYGEHEQLPYRHFGVAAQNLLRNYSWDGDITQLKQFIKAILGNSDAESIELDEVEQILLQTSSDKPPISKNTMQLSIDLDLDLREAREVFEREYLARHLSLCGNNIAELARRVGQERTHLYRKLKTLGLYNKKKS